MNPTNEQELREQVLTEFKQVHKLAPADYTENCTNIVMSLVEAYITANYIPINQPSTNTTPVSDGGGGSESTNQSELEQQIVEYATTLLEARRTNDYQLELENRRLLTAYITANYTLTSEAAERERAARIDEGVK